MLQSSGSFVMFGGWPLLALLAIQVKFSNGMSHAYEIMYEDSSIYSTCRSMQAAKRMCWEQESSRLAATGDVA